MKLNQVQEALLAHLSQSEFQQILAEQENTSAVAEALRSENKTLKSRVEYLEQQITTNAFGGWQVH
jgi:hypothetical protein